MPCGTLARQRSPRGLRPRNRAIFVFTPVSSMKTSLSAVQFRLVLEPGFAPSQNIGAVAARQACAVFF